MFNNMGSCMHKKENFNLECDDCVAWSRHHEKYKLARAEYQKDYYGPDVIITAYLQKVIMLPRCDTFKEIIFVPRSVAYNENFISAGKKAKVPPFAVVCHEA